MERKEPRVATSPVDYRSLVLDSTSDYVLLLRAEDNGVYRVVLINRAYIDQLRTIMPSISKEDLEGLTAGEFAEALNMPSESYQAFIGHYQRAAETGERIGVEEEVPVHGTVFYLGSSYTPIFGIDGRCTHILYVGRDITERVLAERSLQAMVKEREVLIRELFHRTKNNMAVISSLMSISLRDAAPDEIPGIIDDVGDKIQAMSLAHGRLYESSDLTKLALNDLVADIAEMVRLEGLSNGRGIYIEAAENIRISVEVAVPLSMVLQETFAAARHELWASSRDEALNVVLDRQDGAVTIKIVGAGESTTAPAPRARTTVRYQRAGLRVAQEIVTNQLHGRLTKGSGAPTFWTLTIPHKLQDPAETAGGN